MYYLDKAATGLKKKKKNKSEDYFLRIEPQRQKYQSLIYAKMLLKKRGFYRFILPSAINLVPMSLYSGELAPFLKS